MNEDYNPYLRAGDERQQPPAYVPPQPQPVYQQTPQRYPQQTFTNQPPANTARNPYAAARAFGMISFLIGCFVLPATAMIFFNFRSSVSHKFSSAMTWGMLLSVPALVFGVVSLMKKTDKKVFPILGIAFAGVLLLCAFITYFFMVNAAPAAVTLYD